MVALPPVLKPRPMSDLPPDHPCRQRLGPGSWPLLGHPTMAEVMAAEKAQPFPLQPKTLAEVSDDLPA